MRRRPDHRRATEAQNETPFLSRVYALPSKLQYEKLNLRRRNMFFLFDNLSVNVISVIVCLTLFAHDLNVGK